MSELIATISAGLWAGGCLYIGLVEHPAATRLGPEFATRFFRPMSSRAAPMMIILGLIAAVSAGYAWLDNRGVEWLLGALLLAGMFPLTGIFIVPTNLKLLKVDSAEAPLEAEQLLTKWGRLHLVRTVAGSLSFLLFVYALAMKQ